MTIIDRDRTSEDLVANARALRPAIAARAAEVEAARRVPPDLLDQLAAAGCFGALLPTSHHGAGADLDTALRVYEELARADASVGWTVMIGGGAWIDLATLPRATFDALFDRPGVIVAGVFNPSGAIERVDGGYRVNGRWSFASGCEHATWLWGNCVEGVVDGVPQLRGAVLAPDEVVIEDTWNVSGLRGTGSHHFHADGVVVAADRTFVPLEGEPCIDETVVHVSVPSLIALGIASIAVGTAQGALDDIIALATDKVPLLAGEPIAANPWFQHELATAATELRAARALLYETVDEAWTTAAGRGPFTLELRARTRAAAAWITARTAAVVDVAHRAAGGSAVYADSPFQRRQRDIHTVTQHFLVRPDTMTTAGAVLAGLDPGVHVF